MNDSSGLKLKNFRCFRDEQSGRLRPITLLVGENSTGKSSFMASYMAIDQCFKGRFLNDEPDFNLNPFELGAFENIVHNSSTTGENLDEFKIGAVIGNGTYGEDYQVSLTFCKKNFSPCVHKIRYDFGPNNYIEFERGSKSTTISIPGESITIDWLLPHVHKFLSSSTEGISFDSNNRSDEKIKWIASQIVEDDSGGLWAVTNQVLTLLAQVKSKYLRGTTHSNQEFDTYIVPSLMPNLREAIALAPIRSNPKRTYNAIGELLNPQGDHVPMFLMRLSATKGSHWEKFRKNLIEFADSAGLFSDIEIKDFENGGNGPFQVQIRVWSKELRNIIDVGYGVSQCLPVATNILGRGVYEESRSAQFLLQQPEVHLHPRAQAEIGNLICKSYAEFGNRFMIETHSDFIVDRVRVMVRKGVVEASDVSILYFERKKGNSVRLYNLEVDRNGNVIGAPQSYRDFFTVETRRVLGFRD